MTPPNSATPSTNTIDALIRSALLFCEVDADADDPDIVAVADPVADPEAACDDPADADDDEIVAFAAAMRVELFLTTT